ncbi:hypothetical protein AG1IA_05159 [Rhizoctonia solani AG-1 IA]|uniref:Uncharacterized protein n=1 Tax=Thanatephorus cucumeris (strain AG1-IA) TaxID=983506 RepID=L8WVM6_THACA|nr:hypothetical protein AG1IA_05159 [Rhizoctonia solani AG-1 IA]
MGVQVSIEMAPSFVITGVGSRVLHACRARSSTVDKRWAKSKLGHYLASCLVLYSDVATYTYLYRNILSILHAMSDAAKARAEARKKAILSGRTNRLAKLTSTARGEEAAAAFIREAQAQEKAQALAQAQAEAQAQQNDLTLPGFRDSNLRDFVGESTPITSLTPSPGPSRAATPSYMADLGNRTRDDSGLDSPPPVWTPEQEALLRRIMGGPPGAGSPDTGMADPLAAMMSMFSGPGGPLGDMLGGLGGKEGDAIPPALKNLGMGSNPPGSISMMPSMPQPDSQSPGPKPFLPSAFASAQGDELASSSSSLWSRWAMLARRESDSLGVHPMVRRLMLSPDIN